LEPTASGRQSLSAAGGGDDDGGRAKPARLRWVTPHGPGATDTDGGAPGDGGTKAPGPWQPLQNFAQFYAGPALLLTDGTVMVQDLASSDWWKLTPDATGGYVAGTWTKLASAPNGYQPLYYASAVLPDGRVIVEGGEYQGFQPLWTTLGAIYDPIKDQWTPVAPPAGWDSIGDAVSTVLADGRFFLSDCCSTKAALLNPTTLTWTPFGSGKADSNNEEGWTLLPSGDILTVDANNTSALRHTERFVAATGLWTSAGEAPAQLADLNADGSGSHEMGPTILRPDGTVLAIGATGHNAVFDTHTGTWSAAPDLPSVAGQGQLDAADGPAVLLPNGHVLLAVSPGVFNAPVHVFDWDGAAFTEVPAYPQAPNDPSYVVSFLPLPNGQILMTDQSNDIEIYTPTGSPDPSWRPTITNGAALRTLQAGKTYRVQGTQLSGLSQGVAYGDDEQTSTNYPLVRITNVATGHVFYARTHTHSQPTIAPGAAGGTLLDVPANVETGHSLLEVVANGIASAPVHVSVQ
jgi:hypothetical protein